LRLSMATTEAASSSSSAHGDFTKLARLSLLPPLEDTSSLESMMNMMSVCATAGSVDSEQQQQHPALSMPHPALRLADDNDGSGNEGATISRAELSKLNCKKAENGELFFELHRNL
jgi:hypothetical protein